MLAESQALDPGGGTILNLGICRRQEGRTATARAILLQALAQARADQRPDRERTAKKQLAELDGVISRLSVRLSPSQSSASVTIALDGTVLDPAQLHSPLPIDPGEHEVSASAAGFRSWSAKVVVGPVADDEQLTVPALEAEVEGPALPAPLPVPTPTPPPISASREPAASPRRVSAAPTPRADALRPVGYAAIGVGALALGVGSYFGVRALSLKSDSNRFWDGKSCRERSCVDDWHDAQTSALISDLSLGVSLLSLGVGTYLLLRTPTPESAKAGAARLQFRATPAGAFVSTATEF